MAENLQNNDSVFSIIKIAFQPIKDKGVNEGIKDLRKSDHLPLVIMVLAGLSTIIVSFFTFIGYIFREYFNEYVNHALVWSAFGFSLLIVFLALLNVKYKSDLREKVTNFLFTLHFTFNFFLVIIFDVFYNFADLTTFILLLFNVSLSFFTAFVRKLNIQGALSYLVAMLLPLFYFEIDITYYLPFILFTTTVYLLFAEYLGSSKINIAIALITYSLYYYLLAKYASPFTKYYFLSFLYLFGYLYVFFDFIEYNQKTAKVYIKRRLNKLDYSLLLLSQLFVIFSIFVFFNQSYASIAFALLLSSIPFSLVYIVLKKKLTHDLNNTIVSFIILYILLSVVTYFHQNVTALFLVGGIIGLMLIGFGFSREFRLIRKWAYYIVEIVLAFLISTGTFAVFEFWGIELFHAGFYKYLYAELILIVLLFIFAAYKNKVVGNEKLLYRFARGITYLYSTYLYIIILWHTIDFIWFTALLIIPFYVLIYLGRSENSIFIEIIAYLGITAVTFASSIIAYYGILDKWLTTLYSVGFAYLVFFGFIFIVLRYLIRLINTAEQFEQTVKYVRKDGSEVFSLNNQSREKFVLWIADFILQLWFLFIILLLIKYYTDYWFSFIALIPAFFIISWAYLYEKEFSKLLGYFIYGMVAFKILTYSFATQSGVSLFNILQIGFFISLIWFTRINVFYFKRKVSLASKLMVKSDNLEVYDDESVEKLKYFFSVLKNLKFQLKEVHSNDVWKKNQINSNFYILISLWFSIFMFFVGYYIDFHSANSHFGYNLAFFTLFILLFLAGKLKNKTIEQIALFNGIIMFFGLLLSIHESGYSIHFSDQPLFGKIIILQVYFTALVIYKFYDYLVEFSGYIDFMSIIYKAAILLLPFALFYAGYRTFDRYDLDYLINYLPWTMLGVCFILSEIYKLQSLVYESVFWLLVSSLFVYIFPLPSVTLAGVFVLVPFVFYKKGFSKPIETFPKYELLPNFTVFYSTFAVFRAYLLSENDFSGGIFLASSFIFALLFFQNKIYPVKRMRTALYYSSMLLILVGFYFFYMDTNFAFDFSTSSYRIFSIIFMPFSLLIMHKLIFNPKAYPGLFFIAELFIVNIYYIATYSLLIYYFSGDITHLTITFALFVHGIGILFRSVLPRYKLLVVIALLVFSVAIFKLFAIDIRHFSILAKLSFFMLIGILFFSAAIVFNKNRRRFMQEEKKKQEEKAKQEDLYLQKEKFRRLLR